MLWHIVTPYICRVSFKCSQTIHTNWKHSITSATWFNERLKDTYKDVFPDAIKKYRDPIAALHLKSLDDRFLFLRKDRTVVDFGSYPGSWSEVAVERCCIDGTNNSKVIGIDRLQIDPMKKAIFIQGVIGEKKTLYQLLDTLESHKADVVLSDMTPLISGTEQQQQQQQYNSQAALALVAAEAAEEILRLGGTFIVRVPYGSRNIADISCFLKTRFKHISTHVSKYYLQSDIGPSSLIPHYVSHDRYIIAEDFFGHQSLSSDVQIKGHFDPKDGKLGTMTTDLLDRHGTCMI